MNKLSSVFVFIVVSVCVNAQTSSFELGFEAGPSVSWLGGNDVARQYSEPRLSGEGALVLQYNINNLLSIRMAPGFARKGSKAEVLLTDHTGLPLGQIKVFTTLDYFTMPLLLRAGFGDKIKGTINIGPYMGALFASKDQYFSLDRYKAFDAGVSYGLGLQFPLTSKCSLTFEGRHNLGLFNISNVRVVNDGSLKTNSLVLLLGCSWRVAE